MNKRLKFGRRKSDWLIPLSFLAVGVIAAFWASYNRTRKSDLERQKEALEVQVKLLERVVEHYEKGEVANATGPGTDKSPVKVTKPPKRAASPQAEKSVQQGEAAPPELARSDELSQTPQAEPTSAGSSNDKAPIQANAPPDGAPTSAP